MASVGVIGGGLGGIAAALRIRALGYEVVIFDRCARLGGRAQVFCRDGYTFDAGPTVITAPYLFKELFELYGKQIEDYITLVPLNPWYRFVFNDRTTFDYGGSVADTLAEIKKISPDDVKGYQNLLTQSKEIFDIGYTRLADQPFHRLETMLAQIPHLIELKSYRSMWKLVCTHIRDDRLRQAFSVQPLLVGGNPFDTTCIYGLIHYLERKWGVHFPMGGTGALIDGLTRLMREQGIEIRLNTTISQIETSNGKATGIIIEDGQRCVFDTFISDVDPTHLYGRLISIKEQSMSARVKTYFAKMSMGLFVLYFGTAKEYPDVAHHTLWMGARYKTLLEDIFDRKVLAEDFSLYIHRPTATDRSFAPAGHESFYVLVPVPNLSGSINWSVEADRLSSRVIEALDSTILPELKTVIRSPFYMTPEDYSTKYLSTLGSGFSIAPLFSQSAWFRYHNQGEGLENLYLVGAGTHPGAGIPGVLSSAKVVEKLIRLRASDT